MRKSLTIVHFWAGCPKSPNSKWQRFLAIAKRCKKEGWKNYIVWSKIPDNPALYKPFEKEGFEIILQDHSHGNFDLGSIWRTYKLMKSLKCDIFHCHNDHTSPLVGAALARVPVRIWSKLAMSSDYETDSKPKGLHCLMLSTRVSCLCAHRVLAISNKVREELIETVGFEKKIETIYVPIDFQRFTNASKGSIREEFGLDESHIVITSVAHAVPVKGWDIAINAFPEICKKNPAVRMLLVGDYDSKSYYNQLKNLVQQYEMQDKIIFTGKRDDIPDILKASDIFILPSRSDGLCCALIEAMAAGLPCIAANVGGVPEVIHHEKFGILFERENSKELAHHIVRLINDLSLRTELASQAPIRAENFSMKAYVDKVVDIYESLLNKERKS